MEDGYKLVKLCKAYRGGVKMIQRKFYTQRKDGVKLYRTYSDTGMMIRQNETGVEYAEAIDVEGASYTYTETETPIETPEMTTEEMLAELEAVYDAG
jgi:hypothetical protein